MTARGCDAVDSISPESDSPLTAHAEQVLASFIFGLGVESMRASVPTRQRSTDELSALIDADTLAAYTREASSPYFADRVAVHGSPESLAAYWLAQDKRELNT